MKTVAKGEEIVRPALPLLLFPLGFCWLGLYCAQRLVWNEAPHRGIAAILLGLVLVVGLLFIFRRKLPKRGRFFLAACMAVLIGLGCGISYWSSGEARALQIETHLQGNPREEMSLTINEDPKQGVISQTSLATLQDEGIGTIKVRILWQKGQEPAALGTQLNARVHFKALTDKQEFLFQRGVFASVTLDDIQGCGYGNPPLAWVYAFREHNQEVLADIPGDGSALLRGVLLGDTTELDVTQAGNAFKVTGLSHLVAVSGSHLVVIAVVVSWLIGKLKLKRGLEFVLIGGLLIAYVFLTGLQPSAIRSCIMALTASLSPFIGRRGHIPSALAAAALGMLVIYPPAAFSVGFWLSVFAVFGLTLFCPLVIGHMGSLVPAGAGRALGAVGKSRVRRKVDKGLIEPLGLTVTAQLATLPITAPLFATIPFVSPLANLLVTPIVTVLVGAGILLLCLLPALGPVGLFLLALLSRLAGLANVLALICSRIPFASTSVALEMVPSLIVCLAFAGILYHFWPQPSRKAGRVVVASLLSVVLVVSALSLLPVKPQVVVLDVGQGDAILVREGHSTILIDTGSSNTLLLRALARQGVSHIDALIITHLDDDHCGAIDALTGVVGVDSVWFARGLLHSQADDDSISSASYLLRGKQPQELAVGDSLRLGRTLKLTMLWPRVPAKEGSNAESICLALEYDGNADEQAETRMLLTGDAEAPELTGILAAEDNDTFTLLKVGHHGSRDAVTVRQLEQMDTQFALISVGKDNRYGHPTPETLDVLEAAGVQIYRTDCNGEIAVSFSMERLTIRCATITRDLSSS